MPIFQLPTAQNWHGYCGRSPPILAVAATCITSMPNMALLLNPCHEIAACVQIPALLFSSSSSSMHFFCARQMAALHQERDNGATQCACEIGAQLPQQQKKTPVFHTGKSYKLMLYKMVAPVSLSQKRWSVQSGTLLRSTWHPGMTATAHKAMVACCVTACIQTFRKLLQLGFMTCRAANVVHHMLNNFCGGVEGLLSADQVTPDCVDLSCNDSVLSKLYRPFFCLFW